MVPQNYAIIHKEIIHKPFTFTELVDSFTMSDSATVQ